MACGASTLPSLPALRMRLRGRQCARPCPARGAASAASRHPAPWCSHASGDREGGRGNPWVEHRQFAGWRLGLGRSKDLGEEPSGRRGQSLPGAGRAQAQAPGRGARWGAVPGQQSLGCGEEEASEHVGAAGPRRTLKPGCCRGGSGDLSPLPGTALRARGPAWVTCPAHPGQASPLRGLCPGLVGVAPAQAPAQSPASAHARLSSCVNTPRTHTHTHSHAHTQTLRAAHRCARTYNDPWAHPHSGAHRYTLSTGCRNTHAPACPPLSAVARSPAPPR